MKLDLGLGCPVDEDVRSLSSVRDLVHERVLVPIRRPNAHADEVDAVAVGVVRRTGDEVHIRDPCVRTTIGDHDHPIDSGLVPQAEVMQVESTQPQSASSQQVNTPSPSPPVSDPGSP